jgi:FixJ family two-component response regulator
VTVRKRKHGMRRTLGPVDGSAQPAASHGTPLVAVVDDDESVRESLPDLVKAFGFRVRAFASAEEFLASDCLEETRCVLLDIAMPGMTGPELQETLRGRLPIIFITAHTDDATRSRLIEAGAVACLAKPFAEDSLLDALNTAVGTGH